MENLKNIQPIDDFNWEALEKGDSYGEVSKDDLVKTYDETLNTVKDKEVVIDRKSTRLNSSHRQ